MSRFHITAPLPPPPLSDRSAAHQVSAVEEDCAAADDDFEDDSDSSNSSEQRLKEAAQVSASHAGHCNHEPVTATRACSLIHPSMSHHIISPSSGGCADCHCGLCAVVAVSVCAMFTTASW